jgi:hypothetical protein
MRVGGVGGGVQGRVWVWGAAAAEEVQMCKGGRKGSFKCNFNSTGRILHALCGVLHVWALCGPLRDQCIS